jgi:hypothetical protein
MQLHSPINGAVADLPSPLQLHSPTSSPSRSSSPVVTSQQHNPSGVLRDVEVRSRKYSSDLKTANTTPKYQQKTEYKPIQYKPSFWLSPIYGAVQFVLIGLGCRWALLSLPIWLTLLSFSTWIILFTLYCRWQFAIVDDLQADSLHATPMEWNIVDGHVNVKTGGPVASLMMNRAMTRDDALWYFKHITLNFQLNTFCRIGRTIHGMISEFARFGTLRHGSHEQNYFFLMNSSQHRWLQADGHIRFKNAMMPVVDPSRSHSMLDYVSDLFRGNAVRMFDEIVMELDHDHHRMVCMYLDKTRADDAYECMCFIALSQGLYSHPQVHLAATEVSRCVDWKLSREASNAVNGLNRAAVMAIGPVITSRHEDYSHIPSNNIMNGTPHPRGGSVHQILLQNSATYRMLLRAHKDPLLRSYAKHDPIVLVGLIHSGILHGVDHLLPDLYAPLWLRSRTYGSNFTGTILLGAGVNLDFTSSFSRVKDELTERFKQIVQEEAPMFVPGWQWAVAQ